MLQEAAVPQLFSQFTRSTIGMLPKTSRVIEGARRCLARTLSRDVWQQKNFRAHRLRVSSPLAKTGFLSESRAADSTGRMVLRTRCFAIYGE